MKTNKKTLLTEELKRFNMLNEYSFYVPEGDKASGDIDDLLLAEDPEDPEADAEGEATDGEMEAFADAPEGEEAPAEEPAMDGGEAMDEPQPEDDAMLDGGDIDVEPEEEVELDVTELVAATDEAKNAADDANVKVDQLLGMVSKLEGQLNQFDGIGQKIDKLDAELIKRAPTPEEKIEMRSLDSYPYNLKLTDFWADKEGKYDVMNTDGNDAVEGNVEGEPEEYTLTQDDVDSDYSTSQIKNSLDTSDEYEEEDIW